MDWRCLLPLVRVRHYERDYFFFLIINLWNPNKLQVKTMCSGICRTVKAGTQGGGWSIWGADVLGHGHGGSRIPALLVVIPLKSEELVLSWSNLGSVNLCVRDALCMVKEEAVAS